MIMIQVMENYMTLSTEGEIVQDLKSLVANIMAALGVTVCLFLVTMVMK